METLETAFCAQRPKRAERTQTEDLGRPGRSAVRVPLERGITLVLGERVRVEGRIVERLF